MDTQKIPSFDVTIAGETNLDLILYGLPEEMPTERELLGSGFEVTLGGSSSILAHNLAALGARVGFISRVGNDEMGKIALAHLGEGGVDLSRLHRPTSSDRIERVEALRRQRRTGQSLPRRRSRSCSI